MATITEDDFRLIRSEKVHKHVNVNAEDFWGERPKSNGRPAFPGHSQGLDWESHPYRAAEPEQRGVRAESESGSGSAGVGTLISVPTNEFGHVDREHLSALVDRLFLVARDWRRDNVLLDLSGVRSVTSTFVKVVESFGRHLVWQDREVYLYDARQPDGGPRNLSQCEPLAILSPSDSDSERITLDRQVFGFEQSF